MADPGIPALISGAMHYEHATGGQSMLDDLVEFATGWEPDLVIWDAMTFAGPVAARASGAAHARMLFGIDYIGRMYGEYARLLAALPPERRDDPLGDWITGRLARFGRRPGAIDGELAREMMTGKWTIDPTPQWLQLPLDLPLLPVRYLPYNGPTGIPDWVHTPPERPRVCLSMGVTAREVLGGDLFSVSDMLASMAELDIEIVATLDAGQLDPAVALPDNVRIVDFVPLNDLLPSCSAIIHHGGFGTLGNALVHGVPNIIAPGRYWDEIRFGERIEERGAGLILDYQQTSGDGLKSGIDSGALKSMVGRILDAPSFRHNTHGYGKSCRPPPAPVTWSGSWRSWSRVPCAECCPVGSALNASPCSWSPTAVSAAVDCADRVDQRGVYQLFTGLRGTAGLLLGANGRDERPQRLGELVGGGEGQLLHAVLLLDPDPRPVPRRRRVGPLHDDAAGAAPELVGAAVTVAGSRRTDGRRCRRRSAAVRPPTCPRRTSVPCGVPRRARRARHRGNTGRHARGRPPRRAARRRRARPDSGCRWPAAVGCRRPR